MIVVGYSVYLRKHPTLQVAKEQLDLMQTLVGKELDNIRGQKQDLIDKAAKEGKTVPLVDFFAKLDKDIEEPRNDGTK